MVASQPIVVATDGSDESAASVRAACEIALALKAPVTVLTVLPPPTPMLGGPVPAEVGYDETAKWFRTALDRGAEEARRSGVSSVQSVFLQGPVVPRVVEYLTDHPARMLVVGARGLSGSARFILGSVSEGLVHHAPCSVLAVRAGTSAAAP